MKIIPYVMIWEGLVMKYHKKHKSEIRLSAKTEANKLRRSLLKVFILMNMRYNLWREIVR